MRLFPLVALVACGDPDPSNLVSGEAVPEFTLLDVNQTSARFGEPVSPRDYLDQVSAWYFGHAS